MFEICFLGTSAAVPTRERALVSTLLVHGKRRYLIDCAEGVERQLLLSGKGFGDLSHILVTHCHLDHYGGLGGLLLARDNYNIRTKLEVCAGTEALRGLRTLLALANIGDSDFLKERDLKDGTVIAGGELSIRAVALDHTVSSYGFVFEEATRRRFIPEEAERLGVPRNSRGSLARGETLTLPDGTSVTPDMVLGSAQAGGKVVYFGDTALKMEEYVRICRNADCLICEATYLDRDKDLACQYKHMTAKQAATLAVEAGVRSLYLNHVSHRYQPEEIAAEARQIFPTATVPSDFDTVSVSAG